MSFVQDWPRNINKDTVLFMNSKFQKQNDKMEFFIADSFPKQFVFQRNKVEAFTIAGNKKVFATDDENLGAAINISINGK